VLFATLQRLKEHSPTELATTKESEDFEHCRRAALFYSTTNAYENVVARLMRTLLAASIGLKLCEKSRYKKSREPLPTMLDIGNGFRSIHDLSPRNLQVRSQVLSIIHSYHQP